MFKQEDTKHILYVLLVETTIHGLPNTVKMAAADVIVELSDTTNKHLMKTLSLFKLPVIVRFDTRTPSTWLLVGLRPRVSALVSLMLQIIPRTSPAHEKVAFCPSNTLVDCGGWTA